MNSMGPPTGTKFRVLMVEDGLDDASITRRILSREAGVELVQVRSGKAATDAIATGPFQLCLVDYRLPDVDGVQLLAELRRSAPGAFLAMVTSHRSEALVEAAMAAGAKDFIFKNPDFGDRIRRLVQRLRENPSL